MKIECVSRGKKSLLHSCFPPGDIKKNMSDCEMYMRNEEHVFMQLFIYITEFYLTNKHNEMKLSIFIIPLPLSPPPPS